jgi:glycosyltransferase involved in cell wall biosynthesis
MNNGCSVLILTLNEEANLPGCLESVKWCDDVVVLDSYSQDRTEEIAKQAGVRFIQRRFDNYASQRNYGLHDIKYKYPWILMVDADETVPAELATEIQSIVNQTSEDIVLYRVRRKDYLFGQWLKRSSGYPTWFGRLVRPEKVRVERAINEEYHAEGKIGELKNHLCHYPFNKGFREWFEKHNRYSSMEAELMVQNPSKTLKWRDFFTHDPVQRRKVLKQFVYALPGRPLVMFLGLFLWRGGFLDGGAGLRFCLLKSFYELMISCKVSELERKKRGLPV